MPRAARSIREVVTLAVLAFFPSVVAAQEPAQTPSARLRPSFEMFGGWIRSSSEITGTTSMQGSEYDAAASRLAPTVGTTTYQNKPKPGFAVGAALFVTSHFGVEACYDFFGGSLSGPPGENIISGSSGVRVRTFSGVTGTSKSHAVSVGPTARFRVGKLATWRASVGYAYLHFDSRFNGFSWELWGPAKPIRVQASASTSGLMAGTSLHVRLIGPFAVIADVRHAAGKATVPSIASDLELPAESKALSLSRTRITVGLHITPWRKRDVDIVDGWKAR